MAPLFLLLLLGIIEFSWAYYHINILNKSVRDGARYFSDYIVARYDGTAYGLNYPINTSNTNSPNILIMQKLITYGNMVGTGPQLLPGTAPSASVYCYEENKTNAVCLGTTKHIRVTATYNHNFILGNAINNFSGLGLNNPYQLTASTVMRVE
jgi:Flp pilus assembly protein TadG